MNWKKELIAAAGFALLLCVCLFTEPIVDKMTAQAAVIEPEPAPIVVEIQRIELPVETAEPDVVETFYNPTPLTDAEYRVLLETCERCRIAPSLALGLIQVESRFDPNAKSKSGALGYCQLLKKYFGVLSPEDNIMAGIEYLAYQCERYGNTESGLTAYHDGHDTKNTSYARTVMEAALEWEKRLT